MPPPVSAVSATAYARAGLLGNPSDGYGGKAIALAVADFRARVQLTPADGFELIPGETDGMRFRDARRAARAFAATGSDDGLRLMRAALGRFAGEWSNFGKIDDDDPRLRFSLRYETDIPRQVGLAGSSAIVIATLRALCAWFDAEIAPARLAELALAAELEDLGIAAGAMDRVIQAHGGLVAMDLKEPRGPGSFERLDPALLPPLFLAWDPRGGESSGRAHGTLRARWLAGEPAVLTAIEAFRGLVDEGVACLRAGDADGLRQRMNRNFEMRTEIFDVSERDRALVAVATGPGGAAKLCGSGGAVVGMAPPGDAEAGLADLDARYRRAGFGFVRPSPAPEEGDESTASEGPR
jgi:glucuronokinase